MDDSNEPETKKAKTDTTSGGDNTRNDLAFDLSAFNEEQQRTMKTVFDRLQKLQGQNNTLQGQNSTLQGRVDTLQGQNSTLQGRVNSLESRLNGLVSAIGPATDYAVFETAVYAFVEPVIPAAFQSDKQLAEKIKYGVAATCLKVFETLTGNGVPPGSPTPGKKTISFSWQGPSSTRSPNFPHAEKFTVTHAGLKGLVEFVKSVETTKLKSLSSAGRNKLLHDGTFLEAVFASPGSAAATGTEYADTKAMVRDAQTTFQRAASSCSSVSSAKSAAGSSRSFGSVISELQGELSKKSMFNPVCPVAKVVNALDAMAT